LDFDGIDDYVDCGDSEKLRVEGALTLTVAFHFSQPDAGEG
jgi:uncharacterized YccA/Bax inhibitor family protein